MKKTTILLVSMMMLLSVDSYAHEGRSSSFLSVGINGGHGSFSYTSSHQRYSRSRTVIVRGNHHYYGGNYSTYYGNYYPRRPHYIYRQEGRQYINDYPCAPVVVVPSKNHRHYYGCGCRY